jgi:hypothetical protein
MLSVGIVVWMLTNGSSYGELTGEPVDSVAVLSA